MLAESERAAVIEDLARARLGEGLREIPGPEAHRRSPACGDEVRVRVVLLGDRIHDVRWEGHGCTVSTAATVGLVTVAPGLTVEGFRGVATRYLGTLDAGAEPDPVLGDLEAFAGIGRYPLRAGCASLAWRAALDAVAGR